MVQRQSLSPSYYNGNHDDLGLPPDILQVSDKFPGPSAITFELNPDLRQRIVEMLPTQAEARYLCEQAAEHASWQYVSFSHPFCSVSPCFLFLPFANLVLRGTLLRDAD